MAVVRGRILRVTRKRPLSLIILSLLEKNTFYLQYKLYILKYTYISLCYHKYKYLLDMGKSSWPFSR